MNLTEGQLFTIEALNRIEGFVWPEGAKFATFDRGYTSVNFWTDKPTANNPKFFGPLESSVYVKAYHPDWRNSLITREQFESVDGWVRCAFSSQPNDKYSLVNVFVNGNPSWLCGIEAGKIAWGFDNITKWRYHKPTKEAEMKDTEQFQPPIHETYYRYKKQRETTADARKALEASMEAEDKLLEQIKAWNLEYGFDIRVLDESDEKPESEPEWVINEWRDLRVGDEIECIRPYGGAVLIGDRGVITCVLSDELKADFARQKNYIYMSHHFNSHFKFIRRPSK